MKAIFVGMIAAIALATLAGVVLDNRFQQSAEVRFQTEGVRL